MSKNLEFKLERNGQRMVLVCGKNKVELPQQSWKYQIFKEPTTQIPFVSTGKSSVRCICFFRDENEDGNKDDSNRVKGKTVQTVPVPLPGAGGLDSEGKLGFKHIHNMFQVNSSFINQCVFGLN